MRRVTTPIDELRRIGQSIWLDFLRRGLVTSGELERMVRDGWITGMTSNPTILLKAISGSSDYDQALRKIAEGGECTPYDAFLELGGEDVRMAADVLRPVFDETQGRDGYISFEAQAGEPEQMMTEVRRMFSTVGRPNVMIKVPGTQAGVQAVAPLIAEGININITLLFDVDVYVQFARAYIEGLKGRFDRGLPLDTIASVASFFVSRVDTKADALLPEDSPLRGKIAIANARRAYRRFLEIFSGPEWERLAAAGARVQRPLWASTGTKNPAYSDILYVEELVAPDTVNTMPDATLMAFLDHGKVRPAVKEGLDQAEETLHDAAAQGIDLTKIAAELLEEGLASFGADFEKLLKEIEKRLGTAEAPREQHRAMLDGLRAPVAGRLNALAKEHVLRRIWSFDHTVWKAEPAEVANRLGWLTLVDQMIDEAPKLRAFAQEVVDAGYRTAVLLGMGGSSLAPDVLSATFGTTPGMLELRVLDTTDPAEILAMERSTEPARTLFIVASKSGTTIETMSHLAYFWNKLRDGAHFIAITDRGTPLEQVARERGFRRVFLSPADVGGRYSALSYFGLVPAALTGTDLDGLLDRAHEMLHACHYCVPAEENPGTWLGAVMGEAALAGRDKLTLVLPREIASLGDWIEQLIAESTGKEGTGILPVADEPVGAPDVYGIDRLFIAIGEHGGLAELESAGQPVVRLPYSDTFQIGAEFFRWEFATAVTGHVLGINPFDQPNVEEAKDTTALILREGAGNEPATAELRALLEQVKPGDYIAIQAYLPRTDEIEQQLGAARLRLRGRYRVATTVGFGPRYLHSTGQLHKGGPNTGVFIQIVGEDEEDVAIPGMPYTFGTLKDAQALGDLLSLRTHRRRVGRSTLEQLQEVSA
jgi:transaldolase/glucose-6-phosphate isomerase